MVSEVRHVGGISTAKNQVEREGGGGVKTNWIGRWSFMMVIRGERVRGSPIGRPAQRVRVEETQGKR